MSKTMEANNDSAIQFELRSEKLAEDLAKANQRIEKQASWIKAANQFAWAHEHGCPRYTRDAPCNCGLDQFLGRPKPFIESYKTSIAELEDKLKKLAAIAGGHAVAAVTEKARADAAEAKLAAAEDTLLGLIPQHRNPADRCWCPRHVAVPHTPECLKAREVLAWIEDQTARSSDAQPSPANTIPSDAADISGPLTLYVWHDKPPSRDSITFHIEPCEGQWTVGAAKARAKEMVELGHSVWIENASGLVVFRANHGDVEFPLDQKRFWEGDGR
jgi:hypothetical protein